MTPDQQDRRIVDITDLARADVYREWADWLQRIQFPFDFSFSEGELPRVLLPLLAQFWHDRDDPSVTVEEWEVTILSESPKSWKPDPNSPLDISPSSS